ncbi:poly(A) polymerase [Polymorphobacter multimanifer]|uniref:Poly(A) polymerase n=1 Tax=Polymorphobacter multimanifer TaxID=1070431 RepID=A0A841L9S9_9SPHN|nr:poly(A) polymerase [Polymorphobacter multimanifer]
MKLPIPAWVGTEDGKALLAALDAEAGTSRLVGGSVRDPLLGLEAADIDLATALAPHEVMARLRAAGLKAFPTGLAHGTVTAVAGGIKAEVTTLRHDVTTDGRRAEVVFTDDWQADAARRDFTINALYARLPGGEIDDWFGGLEDLAARRVRFIGDPMARIAEDHLRILRFFRFSSRFGQGMDAEGLAACAARANDLMALSRERVALELRGLLLVADPLPVLVLMIEHGIWRPVLPEIGRQDALGRLAVLMASEAALGLAPDWRRRLAALLPADAKMADAVAARLRLSNADRMRVARAVLPADSMPVYAAAWAVGADVLLDRLLMAGRVEDARQLLAWERPRMPVSGKDFVARGVGPGPDVAARLVRFEREWVAAGFPMDADAVATLVDRAMAAAL